jgi:hypothetical protein
MLASRLGTEPFAGREARANDADVAPVGGPIMAIIIGIIFLVAFYFIFLR